MPIRVSFRSAMMRVADVKPEQVHVKGVKITVQWTVLGPEARANGRSRGSRTGSIVIAQDCIGPVLAAALAAVLIAWLPEPGRLNHRRIAALAGLAPHSNDSGQRLGPATRANDLGLSRGKRHVRAAAPVSAARPPRGIHRFAIRPRPKGLPQAPPGRRKAHTNRHHRLRQKAAHHPQRHDARREGRRETGRAKTGATWIML
ncbi:MAG: transposase [Exiguobacterium profundum]|nr:MAG: transposase [Exiguobacterium profundum]